MASWRYYGDNTGALVDMAYAKHAVHLLHRVTHNHEPEVREAAAIHIKEAQMARNTCPRWILAQHGVSTSVGTGIWAQLQLLLLHQTHAILTNHHCDQQGPLVATHTDIHRKPAGEVDTLRLVRATITIVYITPTQMKIMAHCDAHHAPVLSDPQWPARRLSKRTSALALRRQGATCRGPRTSTWRTRLSSASTGGPARASTRPPTTAARRRRSPLSSDTMALGRSPNTTHRRPMYHQSDTVTRAYHARAGTAAWQPSTFRGPCCTSSPPTTPPPPPPPPPISRHSSPSGRGVARRGWTWALVRAPRPAGGRACGPPDLCWSSWPGGCRGRVNPPVPVGATESGRASNAAL